MNASRLLSIAAVCALLLGCAREFPQRAYSQEAQAFRDMLLQGSDYDSRLALARLYFEHNEIDKADALLRELVTEDPDDAQALAWFGANNCKLAGRAQPWLMGFYKLYRVYACLDQVRDAAARAPHDLTVQLVLANTGAVVDMFGSLDSAQQALDGLLAGDNAEGDRYPPGPRAHIFLAAAEVNKARGNREAAADYLQSVIALDADRDTPSLARERLAQLKAGG